MTIVCLGWGSLLWDPRELPIASEWRYDGPDLPIEFARQSADGRLTLVITPGVRRLRVFSAALDVKSMNEARDALARREGISAKLMDRSVGHWDRLSSSNHGVAQDVGKWASEFGYEGVVWTALKPKFGDTYTTPSRVEVENHLQGLKGDARVKAEEYVRFAPREIRTAYREEIERALGLTPKDKV